MAEQNNMVITPEQANRMRQDCNKQIELAERLKRLQTNQDFIVLIKTYTEEDPVRLTMLLAEPSFNLGDKKKQHREELTERLIGIARFNEYLNTVFQNAEIAKKTIGDLAKAEAELNAKNNIQSVETETAEA